MREGGRVDGWMDGSLVDRKTLFHWVPVPPANCSG